MKNHKVKGSITVFLCLIMVLIVAILGSSIDLARIYVAEGYSYRALNSAVDTVFTNYCEELYEEYHLFLLMNNKELESLSGEEFVETMSEYLYDTFSPDSDVTLGNTKVTVQGTDMMDIAIEDCQLVDTTTLLDYDSTIFQHQVQEYMKYEVVEGVAEEILQKLNGMDKSKKTMTVLRKKMEVEEKVSKIDRKILQLMQEVEGLTVTKSGLKITKQGLIAMQDSFAKKFCTVEVRPSTVNIRHNVVWDSVSGHYTNPITLLQSMKEAYEKITDESNPPKKAELREVKEQLKKETNRLYDEAKDIKIHIEKAQALIKEVAELQSESRKELGEFGQYLESQKGEIDADSYKGIQEEYMELTEYVGKFDSSGIDTSIVGNIVAMQNCLEGNKKILEETQRLDRYMTKNTVAVSEEYYELVKQLLTEYQSYTIQPLQFQYETLSLDTKAVSPFSLFSDLIADGLLGLVLDDPDGLSKASLEGASLPFDDTMEGAQEWVNTEEKKNEDLAGKLKEQEGEESSGISTSMEEYEASCESLGSAADTAEGIARRFLLNEYGISHYKSLTDSLGKSGESNKKSDQKETVLEYEQEYLLVGAKNDHDNVKSIIMKTIFIRTALNYITLVSDKGARLKAHQSAVVLVGFTGFTPLISITKHLILMTWAFEESLVDTRALIEGKEVPLYKKANQISVQFQEMLSISKELIKTKANNLPEKGAGTLSFSYQDYLRFYMLMVGPETLSNRMMNLIEKNMQARYNPEFRLQEGIFGVKVRLLCSVEGKFLGLPGIQELSGYEGSAAVIEVETEYSY